MATTEEQLLLLNTQVSTLTTDVNTLLTAVQFKKQELDDAYNAILNAPDTPVFTVNGRIGNVVLNLTDITDALAFTPYNSNNPSGFVTALTAPVRSVAGKTGLVALTTVDIGGLAAIASTGQWSDIVGKPATFPTNLANGATPGAVFAGPNVTIVNGQISVSASTSGGTTTEIIDPRIILRRITAGTTPLALTTDGSSPLAGNQLSLPDNSAMVVEGLVVARREGGSANSAWRVKALFTRGVGAASVVLQDFSVDTISNANGWILRPSAETTTGALRIVATGGTGINVSWTSVFTKHQVTY